MPNNKQHIVCAAIWYGSTSGKQIAHQPQNIQQWIVICWLRHCNCYPVMYEIPWLDKNDEGVEGFLTSTNVFVTREIAADIALAAWQLKLKKSRLFSEDLY